MIFPRILIVYLLLGSQLSTFAQKTQPKPASNPSYSPEQCMAAFYLRDSIAIQLPDARPKYDAIKASQKKLDEIRDQQIPATDRMLTAQSDSVKSKTDAGKKEIKSAKAGVLVLRNDSLVEIENIREQYELLQPTYNVVDWTADSIAKARGMKQVRESADNSPMICPTDQMLMIDITNDIAVALGLKPHLLRVGTFHSDSLLHLMTGYTFLSDSTKVEMAAFNKMLAQMDGKISSMQRELDSLRPHLSRKKIRGREADIAAKQEERDIYRGYELYKIDVKDSIRVSSYRKKLRMAAASAAKEYGCLKYYDIELAHDYWTTDEAEFIDLNAAIAAKLQR